MYRLHTYMHDTGLRQLKSLLKVYRLEQWKQNNSVEYNNAAVINALVQKCLKLFKKTSKASSVYKSFRHSDSSKSTTFTSICNDANDQFIARVTCQQPTPSALPFLSPTPTSYTASVNDP